jgi:hypothetical protein
MWPAFIWAEQEARMLAHTIFSFANASPEQTLAFIGIGISDIAFLIWIAYLVRW